MSDLISRQSLKQKLQKHHDFFIDAYGVFSNLPQNDKSRVDEIANCIAMVVNEPSVTIPSVENKGEWIPVSERLPEDEEDVLVYCERGGMRIAYYHHDYTFYSIGFKDLNETGWYDENDDAMYPEPIAWMPLPEPYKAKRGE